MSNRLINESSPYLLQHAHNPVNWYPWGDEPFERAKEENKPVLVSIGYAACHWCHVMEHESFENETVAALMNEHFICIKVDREEHPDVDHLYMDAVQAISGSGGWPLNVFTTPERVPFYGGTYYPPRPAYGRASWLQVLERMHEIWTQQSDEVAAQSGQMLQYLKNASVAAVSAKGENWNEETANIITDNLLKLADKVYGGFGQAPKFPGTMAISYLLEHYKYTGNIEAKKHALHSLDAMLAGGINDQLAGGFARYSTDAQWLAPHFEKMLYDNALIIHALCDAYRITKKDRYEHAIRQTISFVENELKDASGGYYSALDADSEGVEGKYYTWTWDEWQEIAGSDDVLSSYFGVKKQGNWEHTNILHEATDIAKLAGETGVSEAEITARVREVKQKLLEARNKRIRPATDDKCLLSWNTLMNIALSKAAGVLGDESFRSKAIAHMQWMQDSFIKENTLKHTWKNGLARIDANLEDYAFLVQAMLQLASVSGDNAWITGANSLVQKIIENFSCEDATFFYFSAAGKRDIPVRKTDVYDGALPSANAVMAHNLLILSLCMESVEYRERAYVMLHRISSTVKRYSYSFAYWAMLLQRYLVGLKTVVCTANQASVLHRYCIPEAYIVTSQKEISELPLLKHKISWSENNVFICTQDACMPPMPLLADVLQYFNIPNE